MNGLPMNLALTLTEIQVGALKSKSDIAFMIDKLNNDYCSDANGDLDAQLSLKDRSLIINDLIARLGTLSDFQKGYIYSLLELVEIEADDGRFAKDVWMPSLVSGKWQ